MTTTVQGGQVKKSCFVIAPIGEEDSDTRRQSDQVLRHVIRPAVEPLNYEAAPANEIAESGIITNQVMQRILESDLVIADLTDWNPNVFYELAVRHAVLKPFVQIIAKGEKIPFDVAATRTVFFDISSLDGVSEARVEIRKQVENLERDPSNLQTPITIPFEYQRIRQNEDAVTSPLFDILPAISDIASTTNANRSDIQRIREFIEADLEGSTSGEGISARDRRFYSARQSIRIALQGGGPFGFVIALSAFRPRVPWVYELGMEAFRLVMSKDIDTGREVFRILMDSIYDSPSRLALGYAGDYMDELRMLFERLVEYKRGLGGL